MNTALQQFQFETHQLRVVIVNDEPWFVAADVARILEYQSAKDLARMCEEDERGRHIVPTPSGDQTMNIISEPGLYRALAKSRSELAKPFQRKLFHEILPAIRKTGGYIASPITARPDSLETVNARLDRLEMATVAMSNNIGRLADIAAHQAEKLEYTGRYIGLLEINQKGKVKITRRIEAEVFALKAQGMPQADIARRLRISAASVNLLAAGRYKFAATEQNLLPKETVEEIMDEIIERERQATLKRLQGGEQ